MHIEHYLYNSFTIALRLFHPNVEGILSICGREVEAQPQSVQHGKHKGCHTTMKPIEPCLSLFHPNVEGILSICGGEVEAQPQSVQHGKHKGCHTTMKPIKPCLSIPSSSLSLSLFHPHEADIVLEAWIAVWSEIIEHWRCVASSILRGKPFLPFPFL